jgi:hypothetical protein
VITVSSSATKEHIVQKGVEKHSSFDQSFDNTVAYVLLYPDYREVRCIPGTTQPFVLSNYKQAIGKDYKRLTFYLIPLDNVLDNSDENDKEVEKSNSSDIRNYGFHSICPPESKPNLPNENNTHPVIDVDDQDNATTSQASGEFNQYAWKVLTQFYTLTCTYIEYVCRGRLAGSVSPDFDMKGCPFLSFSFPLFKNNFQ